MIKSEFTDSNPLTIVWGLEKLPLLIFILKVKIQNTNMSSNEGDQTLNHRGQICYSSLS